MRSKRRHLVTEHLENVSRKILAKYPESIREFARNRNGIYALYRKDRVCYLGLTTNLRRRLKQHLRDQHAQTWDRFSLYLTADDQHLREIESLFLRISKPCGNTITPKLMASDYLRPALRRQIKERQRAELEEIAPGGRTRRKAKKKAKTKRATPRGPARPPTLAQYVKEWFFIRCHYKGKSYLATVRSNGTIRYDGTIYNSPSAAAQAITKRPVDGGICGASRITQGTGCCSMS